MKQLPVFVYGTLLEGFGNHGRILRGRATAVEAQTTGYMFSVGAFPALIKNDKGIAIKGQLMFIDQDKYERTLHRLDMLEGYRAASPQTSMYIREKVEVVTEGGQLIEAWIYYWNGSYKRLESVPSGCWRTHTTRGWGEVQDALNYLKEGK